MELIEIMDKVPWNRAYGKNLHKQWCINNSNSQKVYF